MTHTDVPNNVGWMNERIEEWLKNPFWCVFRLEKAGDYTQLVHELRVGIIRPSSSSHWSWQKSYTRQDIYFCNCGFLSLVRRYLSYWWLGERWGTWQTCSKWNISELLLIVAHVSSKLPSYETILNSCEWMQTRLIQRKAGAGWHSAL